MRPRRPERGAGSRRQGGFTLLETLVVLVLLSFMAAVVVEAYRAGLSMWERQHRETSSLDTARVVLERMREQIKSAYPWSFREGGKSVPYLRGAGDSLDFTSLVGLTSRRENGVLHAVRYRLVDAQDGKRLRMEEFPWPRRGFPGEEEPMVGEDVPGITGIELSYQIVRTATGAAAKEPGGKTAGAAEERRWTDSWPGAEPPGRGETLAAVSVSITMSGGEGEEPAEYTAVVPVMRNAPAGEGR